ncbi:hypothetical protein SANT12839_083050 [Streptomyces antimycoticus]|uniref:PAS domain-containing protein n=1 Tax=Streptomyces antimycoticus TaxID=68175 RepID=A0A4D4KNG8_9ACTN|nr:hypothetical protein SANT12839_083050 [Streptomyces antimycoticus]
MTRHDRVDQEDEAGIGSMATAPGGVLDLLRVAAVALDVEGRIALWSPEAEQLFGYRAAEALGRRADKLLVHPKDRRAAVELFARVRAGDTWAGVFPVRRPDGSTLKVEFRTMGLRDAHGEGYALGLAADEGTVRRLETDLAVSGFLIGQSPVGLAVFDTELRWLRANPALQQMNSITEPQVRGLRVGEALPGLDSEVIEAAMRHVLESGEPLLDQQSVGRTPADPDHDHAWSESYYRLEDPSGRILGVAVSIMDISRRHRETSEIAEARERLAVIADASVRVGTTLDLRQTAQELADVTVPRLADLAAVDVLDSVVHREATPRVWTDGSARFRALAVAAGYPTDAVHAADPVGEIARYDPTRLITQCVREARPILVPHVTEQDVRRIARDDDAARVLLREGVHSYIAAPLIARGSVLGTLSLHRTINPRPFDEEDLTLACELAIRAALCIDNARLYARERDAALTLQRSLLSQQPRDLDGLEIASRYLPAVSAAGGDWFDVLPLPDGRVGLVVGDVMGKGIHAAAIMGQLRTATRAFSRLDLPRPRCCVISTRSRSAWGSPSPPVSTRSAIRAPGGARCPPPAICRRCWCSPAATPSSSTSPPAPRWASAASPSPRWSGSWPRGRCWPCSPTAWWKSAISPSTSDCTPWSSCCAATRARWSGSATRCWPRCTGRRTTMWPCYWPGCAALACRRRRPWLPWKVAEEGPTRHPPPSMKRRPGWLSSPAASP